MANTIPRWCAAPAESVHPRRRPPPGMRSPGAPRPHWSGGTAPSPPRRRLTSRAATRRPACHARPARRTASRPRRGRNGGRGTRHPSGHSSTVLRPSWFRMPEYALALVWHRPFALPFVEGQLPLCGRRRGSQSMVAEAHLAGRASGRSAVLDPVGPGRVAEGALARSQPDSRPVRSETGAVPRDRTTSVRAPRRRSSWLDEASASPALPVPPRATSGGPRPRQRRHHPGARPRRARGRGGRPARPREALGAHQVPGRRPAGA